MHREIEKLLSFTRAHFQGFGKLMPHYQHRNNKIINATKNCISYRRACLNSGQLRFQVFV